MYGWDEDPSSWYGKGTYAFDAKTDVERKAAAERARNAGPRTYHNKSSPDTQRTDPTKKIASFSKTPLLVAVDVTGSMASWPYEIFDRLPLLYNTLAQYRPDLEVAFLAIGDDASDRWPLQVTQFSKGFDLEAELKALYGEGGGGDIPESYGLLAWYLNNRVTFPNAHEKPFVLLFGDAPMKDKVSAAAIQKTCNVATEEHDSVSVWREVAEKYNAWFLRRPTGREGDATDTQWRSALGPENVVVIEDEARAIDCAMGIVARAWGRLSDFEENLLARQNEATVGKVSEWIQRHGPRALECPKCLSPIPPSVFGRWQCSHCGSTLVV